MSEWWWLSGWCVCVCGGDDWVMVGGWVGGRGWYGMVWLADWLSDCVSED
jgi:hypothetical protein